jgi:peptidylprolyl isomerase
MSAPVPQSYAHVLSEAPPPALPTYYGRNRRGIVSSRELTSEGVCREVCNASNQASLQDAQEVFASKGKELVSLKALAGRQALQDSIFGELDVAKDGRGGAPSSQAGTQHEEVGIPSKMMDVEARREKEWENYQRSHRSVHTSQSDSSHRSQLVGNTSASSQAAPRPRAFVDVSAGEEPLGRMMIELFSVECPEAVRNFQALLTGSAGFDFTNGVRLDYLGTPAHYNKVGGCVSFGLLGGQSISSTGAPVREENFRNRHQQRGTVSMVSNGPNGIGSAFSITLGPAPHLDYVQQVVGVVVDGLAVLDLIEELKGGAHTPLHITFCGMLSGDRPRGSALLTEMGKTQVGREAAAAWSAQMGPVIWGDGTVKKAATVTGMECVARMMPATAPTRPSFGAGVVDVSDVEGSSVGGQSRLDGRVEEGSSYDDNDGEEESDEGYYDD